jgi:hypothetical protein
LKLGVTRREALHGIGAAALAVGLPALAGCSLGEEEIDARLAAAMTRLSGGTLAPAALAAAAPLPRSEAVARLRGDTSPALLWAATSSGVALRAFLARGRAADLRDGRIRWVQGWLLTETEIAAANLAAD